MAKASTDPRTVLARAMSEAQLQQAVIEAAKFNGWHIAHFRAGMTRRGRWVTPVSGDGAGFPDLVLAHPDRGVLFVELKAEQGKMTSRQAIWLTLLGTCNKTYVWRPRDWLAGTILAILRGIEEKP